MRTITIAAAALVAALTAPTSAYTFRSSGPWGTVWTSCGPHYCNTWTSPGVNSGPRVIEVPQEQAAAREPELSEAERAARRRASCASPSVQCMPEPAW